MPDAAGCPAVAVSKFVCKDPEQVIPNLVDAPGALLLLGPALMLLLAVVGAALGTSTTGAYIESAAGVQEGGRTGLASIPLKFGDTLLIQGTRANIHLLSQQPDLLVLGDEAETGETRTHRAPLAASLLLLMMGIIAFDIAPVAIGTLLAATLMVLLGCLTLDDAYAAIEWKAVFLVAGTLPLAALQPQLRLRWVAGLLRLPHQLHRRVGGAHVRPVSGGHRRGRYVGD